jgi:hypothetical protein
MYFTNDFYLYPKYLKPYLMAHYCKFAGKGSLPPPCRAAGPLPPKASAQIKIIFIYI